MQPVGFAERMNSIRQGAQSGRSMSRLASTRSRIVDAR
jgi:hypothetical protein